MANWTGDELDTIGKADELQIVTVRSDGTKRKPVTIWVVRHGDDLYVRSGYGDRAAWYRGRAAAPRRPCHGRRRREGCALRGGRRSRAQRRDRRRVPQQIPASWRAMGR